MNQYSACIRRMITEKKRNYPVTCCECFSHLLIVVLLVFGYGLSEIVYYPDEVYSEVNMSLPPSSSNSYGLSAGGVTNLFGLLNGPLLVPSFDQYISVSNYLSGIVNGNAIVNLVLRSSYGQKFGNLLQKGVIHLAPNSTETASFLEYMRANLTTFPSLTVYVHNSEDEAVSYILDHLEERTFFLLVFHQVNPERVNYEIRMNYTVLPNSNNIISYSSLGLVPDYQQYFLSGFLSVQDTVDRWAYVYTGADSTSKNCSKPAMTAVPFPTYAYSQNPFYQSVGFLLGLAMTSMLFLFICVELP